MDRPRFRFLSIAFALLISGAVLAHGQDQKTAAVPKDPKAAQSQPAQEQDPLTRPLPKSKAGRKESNAFKKEEGLERRTQRAVQSSVKSGKNSRLRVREEGSLSVIKRSEILAFPFLKDLKSDYAYCSQGVV